MKRIFSILFALVLVLSFSLVTASPVKAAIINVPGDYLTIQAAIDAAAPGDTIVVAAGVYNEQVNVNKSVTVKGEDWPVVNGQPSAFLITGAGATVKGFDVWGQQTGFGTGNDVIAVRANNVTVKDNRVTGTGPYTTW